MGDDGSGHLFRRECVDCGDLCYAIPEAPVARCEKCAQIHYDVPRPVDRLALAAPRGSLTIRPADDRSSTVSTEQRRERLVDLPEQIGLELRWRAGALAELPKGAQQLVAASGEGGWGWRAYVITRESWCVWLKRGNQRVLAYWVAKTTKAGVTSVAFDCAVLYGDAPLRTIGINDLKRSVKQNTIG